MSTLALPALAPRHRRSFDTRSTEPEVMDADWMPIADYARCLRDLASVNRVTMTHRPTLRWLQARLAHHDRATPVVVLDVGFGQGDLLRAIASWAQREGFTVELHGVDLNPRSAEEARARTPPELDIHFHTADVFAFEPPTRPDFIVSSQFTHHLADGEIVALLKWFEQTAKEAWCIVDLERSRFAWHAFPLLCALARWHPVVCRDGQVSIARALRAEEWQALLRRAGVSATLRTSLLFRHCVSSS